MLLLELTPGESFDVVMSMARGFEVYRRLAQRYDPSRGRQRRNLLKAIIQPGRVLFGHLAELSIGGESRFDATRGSITEPARGTRWEMASNSRPWNPSHDIVMDRWPRAHDGLGLEGLQTCVLAGDSGPPALPTRRRSAKPRHLSGRRATKERS